MSALRIAIVRGRPAIQSGTELGLTSPSGPRRRSICKGRGLPQLRRSREKLLVTIDIAIGQPIAYAEWIIDLTNIHKKSHMQSFGQCAPSLPSRGLSHMTGLQTEAVSQRSIAMEFLPTSISGLYMVRSRRLNDPRGAFTKIFHADMFSASVPNFAIREVYFSTSRKGVVRGLHFQTASSEQAKLVFCLKGSIFDVSVDLRRSSPTYGQHFGIELTEESALGVLVPEGCAHGMQTLVDGATGVMAASAVYAPDREGGIAWNSCGIAWPCVPTSISEKDQSQPALADFASPFP